MNKHNDEITIASWNVNSINARAQSIELLLKQNDIDILLIQELKCENKKFPYFLLEKHGYNLAINGQKTYNGVCIASKYKIEDVTINLPNFDDPQARFISCFTANMRVACIYVPNGQEVGSDKYKYKLQFLQKLSQHLNEVIQQEQNFIIGGDFNIAYNKFDCYTKVLNPKHIMTSPKEVNALHSIINLNLIDIVRDKNPIPKNINSAKNDRGSQNKSIFSWWDYRKSSWLHNKGFRIDHILTSPAVADIVTDAYVESTPRDWQKASDHAPVICKLKMTDM